MTVPDPQRRVGPRYPSSLRRLRVLLFYPQACEALQILATKAAEYDTDGIDIYFLNDQREGHSLRTPNAVEDLFKQVAPSGGTYTGARLDALLRPYLAALEASDVHQIGRTQAPGSDIKPRNILVITDGEPADDPACPIIECVRRLQAMPNLSMTQLGIQFVQIGDDEEATQALKQLDDTLHKTNDIRDIVDTTPYSGQDPDDTDWLIKVLIGGINRRIDR
ncbi:hypothetical protein C8R47DRAFT_1255475, partial [Mycena vitilis]